MHPQKTMQPEPVTARFAARGGLHQVPRRARDPGAKPQRRRRPSVIPGGKIVQDDLVRQSHPRARQPALLAQLDCNKAALRPIVNPAGKACHARSFISLGWWESENQTVTPDRQTPYKLDQRFRSGVPPVTKCCRPAIGRRLPCRPRSRLSAPRCSPSEWRQTADDRLPPGRPAWPRRLRPRR